MSNSFQPYTPNTTRVLCPRDSPGKDTGVGCHAPPGDLPDAGTEPAPLTSPALAGGYGRFLTSHISRTGRRLWKVSNWAQRAHSHPLSTELWKWNVSKVNKTMPLCSSRPELPRYLSQRLETAEESDSEYVWLYGPSGLWPNNPTLPL